MFVVAARVYFAMTESDYPSRWLVEDSGFVFGRKHRRCLWIGLAQPEDYRPYGAVAVSTNWGSVLSVSLSKSRNLWGLYILGAQTF